MSLRGIALYSLRAGIFAAAICALYALICLLRRRRPGLKRLLGIAYIAALVQITVLRGGVNWQAVLHEGRQLPQLLPFGTTLALLGGGTWNFIYNTLGNLLWFVPLGMLLAKRRGYQALLAGALVSACIETGQYILMTGQSDIDDVIINALGTLLGWAMLRLWRRLRA